MGSVADEVVLDDEKEQCWRAAEEAMARLRQNPDDWKDYQEEAAAWDATSADGLDDPPYELVPEKEWGDAFRRYHGGSADRAGGADARGRLAGAGR